MLRRGEKAVLSAGAELRTGAVEVLRRGEKVVLSAGAELRTGAGGTVVSRGAEEGVVVLR